MAITFDLLEILEHSTPTAQKPYRWAFLLTFAGVGLRTNLRELGKQGAWPLIVGAVGEIVIALITLAIPGVEATTLASNPTYDPPL
jgi:uncharacterized membrane protein YadS